MKAILVLVAFCIVKNSLVESVTYLKPEELTEELVNDTRYILSKTKEGLIQVEDLQISVSLDLSLSVTEDDVSFYIYTPENPDNGVQIRESQLQDIVQLTGFNINRSTLVIIHGWVANFESPVNSQIRTAALSSHNINVIVVDWSPIADQFYTTAQAYVLPIGNYVGDFLLRLDNELNYSISKFTVVGHSLGAHISGNIGARTNGLIEAIVGLDPAGPLFTTLITINRLDQTDGQYVQVIHTDLTFGFFSKIGHADYYPNGGTLQPGCGILDIGCSHNRAYEYYAESLGNNNFVAKLCDSDIEFSTNLCNNNTASLMGGYPIQETTSGKYYLNTNSQSPFAQG